MKIAIALVGLGYWGEKMARCLEESDKYELCAIIDPSPHAREKTLVPSYSSFEEALPRLPQLQAVAIATPMTEQAKLVELALQHELHVLVTKTLATNSKKARELIELARKKNKALFVDYTFLYAQGFKTLQNILQTEPKTYWPKLIEMRRRALGKFDSTLPVHWDLACHDLSLILSLFPNQTLKSIQAVELTAHYDVSSQTEIILEVDDFKIRINSAWDSPQKTREIEILGSDKNIHYSGCYPNEKLQTSSKGHRLGSEDIVEYSPIQWEKIDFKPQEPLPKMIREFSDMISAPFKCPTEMYLKIIQLLEWTDHSLEQDSKKLSLRELL